jgi:hypothetical protein
MVAVYFLFVSIIISGGESHFIIFTSGVDRGGVSGCGAGAGSGSESPQDANDIDIASNMVMSVQDDSLNFIINILPT